MRSTLVAAAFAAGALAVPFNEKRANAPQGYGGNVETAYDVVYVTNVVTVTANGDAPAYTPEAKHYGHKHKKPVTTTQEAAPVYTPETTYEAPASTYEAPAESSPSSSPSTPAGPASDSYADTCLYHHNLHRANHSAPALTWSDSLAATAQKIADSCVYAHDTDMDGGGYGQNIAAGVESNNISAVITDLFYNGEEPLFANGNNYGLDDPDMSGFEGWGHFTQIVWVGTTEVGCATSQGCTSLANTGSGVSPYFTVCNYKGPGNYAGQYKDNVNPPNKEPTMYWDAAEKAVNKATSYRK